MFTKCVEKMIKFFTQSDIRLNFYKGAKQNKFWRKKILKIPINMFI